MADTFQSHTERTEWRTGRWLGHPAGPCVTVIDTPGLEDTEGGDLQLTGDIGQTVRQLGEINVFLVLLRSDTTRLTPVIQKQLNTLTNLFGSEFWKKVCIEITFWRHDTRSRRKRGKKTMETNSENLRSILKEKLNIDNHLEVLYVDSKLDPEDSDDFEIEIFQAEAQKILEKSRESDSYSCSEGTCQDTGERLIADATQLKMEAERLREEQSEAKEDTKRLNQIIWWMVLSIAGLALFVVLLYFKQTSAENESESVLENPQRSTETPPGHTPTDSSSRLHSNSATMTLETNGE